jgi:hypothetical protein
MRSSPDHREHATFLNSRLLTGLALGGLAVGAAVILAPQVMPALGIGSAQAAEDAMFSLHTSMDAGGSGVAGTINNVLSAVPLIGEKLAEGGLFNAAATATIGIGGVLLGQFIAKREDGSKRIKWGNVIKYAALATSAMIALPTVLTALSTGIIYLSSLFENRELLLNTIGWASQTLGAAGDMAKSMMGFSGLAAVIPHFLTCGAALLPPALAFAFSGGKEKNDASTPYSDGSVAMRIVPDAPLEAGKPCTAKLTLSYAATGAPLTEDELAVVHTRKLHLFVVDSSLKDYRHIHPEPTGTPGEFRFTFTPAAATGYSAWAEFTLIANNKNHKLLSELPAKINRRLPPSIKANSQATHEGLSYHLTMDEPLATNKPVIVTAEIRDANGQTINDLEPVMGAFAHLVGFGRDGKTIVHTHPLGKEPESADERGEGKLRFHVEPDFSGPAQFYLQLRHGGKDSYIPFGQHIKPLQQATHWAKDTGHGAHVPGY